jgi:hypothetical protein
VLLGHSHVVVIQELAPHGSLGGRVKALAWETAARCRLYTSDAFHYVYGTHGDLLAAHGLTRDAIVSKLVAP